MDNVECVLESPQKNPFKINCTFCNEKAIKMKFKEGDCNEVVHGYGDSNAKIVIVGEGPGKNGAAITGIPFTKDESGKRVQIGLVRSNYSEGNEDEIIKNKRYIPKLDGVFTTNIFRFYGYKRLKGIDSKKTFDDALKHLNEELNNLSRLNKIKIIPVGKTAYESLKNGGLIDSTVQDI